MSLISRLFHKRSTSDQAGWNPFPFFQDGSIFLSEFGSGKCRIVTPENALQVSAVLACVGRIARDLSTLPLQVFDDQTGKKVTKHPLVTLFRNLSPYSVPSVAWQAYLLNLLIYGFGCAVIEHAPDGITPTAILPVMSRGMAIQRVNGLLIYQVGGYDPMGADKVLHTPYLSLDGISGRSPVQMAKDVIGTAMALDDFAMKFFTNGANTGTFIELPKMGRDALKEAQEMIKQSYSGQDNAHKVMAIPEAKVHKIGVSPRDSQAIEARDFQLREIARIFCMPVGIIDAEKSKYAGLEAQFRDYSQSTLRPIAVMIEQELERKLLREDEQGRYSIRWNLDAIVRASLMDRTNSDTSLVQGGIMTPNEARDHHGLTALPGGDTLMSPLNMAPAATRSAPPQAIEERTEQASDALPLEKEISLPSPPSIPSPPSPTSSADDQPAASPPAPDPRLEASIRSIAQGIAVKEANAARKAAGKPEGTSDEFRAWALDFFAAHADHLKTRLPFVDEKAAAVMSDQARDALIAAQAEGRLDATLASWGQTRPDGITALALAA